MTYFALLHFQFPDANSPEGDVDAVVFMRSQSTDTKLSKKVERDTNGENNKYPHLFVSDHILVESKLQDIRNGEKPILLDQY